MGHHLIKNKSTPLTVTEYAEMQQKLKKELTQKIFTEIQEKVTSLQAQALMLSFGAALSDIYGADADEILKVLEKADSYMADFWTTEDLEKFRSEIIDRCGFDIRIPGYADDEGRDR